MTVGSGFAPDLLTSRRSARGLPDCSGYRRWGIAPRPKNSFVYRLPCSSVGVKSGRALSMRHKEAQIEQLVEAVRRKSDDEALWRHLYLEA
jgi:hypothetical protein